IRTSLSPSLYAEKTPAGGVNVNIDTDVNIDIDINSQQSESTESIRIRIRTRIRTRKVDLKQAQSSTFEPLLDVVVVVVS
ncbi:hypothetical protein SERLA73DRAFT_139655, partial [Serpula lacrymans var. lacrymans S7.3]